MTITPSMSHNALADVLEGIELDGNLYEPAPCASDDERESYRQMCERVSLQQDAIVEAIERLRELSDKG